MSIFLKNNNDFKRFHEIHSCSWGLEMYIFLKNNNDFKRFPGFPWGGSPSASGPGAEDSEEALSKYMNRFVIQGLCQFARQKERQASKNEQQRRQQRRGEGEEEGLKHTTCSQG